MTGSPLRAYAAARWAATTTQRGAAVLAQQLYDAGERTVQQIADLFGVPRSTVYGISMPRPRADVPRVNRHQSAVQGAAGAPMTLKALHGIFEVRLRSMLASQPAVMRSSRKIFEEPELSTTYMP